MAQAKTIQLLRSSQLYVPSEGKTALENAKAALTTLTGRKDGEIVLARYQETNAEIKSVLGIYHTSPDLGNGQGAGGADVTYSGGWTFIQDITSSTEGLTQLQAEIDRIETNVGLSTDGTYTGYSNDPVAGTSTTLKATADNIITYIKGLDLTEVGGTSGDVITAVSQADGKVSASKSSLTDVVMTGYAADSTKTGAIAATDTLEQAFNKVENAIAKNTVSSADKTVKITQPTTGDSAGKTDLSVNIDGTTLVKDNSTGVISSALKVIKVIPTGTAGTDEVVDDTLGANIKEAYRLVYNGSNTAIGKQINVYKDSALSRVYLGHMDDTINASTGAAATTGTGDTALCFVYLTANGTYTLVPVNVETFLSESEFSDGLQVANHVVSVKIDSSSEKDSQSTPVDFLTVSSNGIKVSGIKDEIDRKIAALDVTDTAVAGQYVSAVNETDGKVAMTRANVSEAVLNNYAKGTAPASLDIAATDTINQAFAKLEHKIADGVASLDAEVTSTDGTNVQVKVTEVDGVITAVNVTTDNTINATDLSDAIDALDGSATATAASGNVYSVLTSVVETDGVISKGGEVTLAAVAKTGAAADVSITDSGNLLDASNVEAALQEIAGKSNTALQSVSGSNAITVGTKTNNDQQISLKLDTSTGDGVTAGTVTDMLTITNNGLAVNDTWDCGTF